MIVMQIHSGRRLAGNIGRDVDLFDGLRELCKNHGVKTAELRGIGYLKDIRLAIYDPETNRFEEDDVPTPAAQCLSLLGNISSSGAGDTAPPGPSFHLQAILSVPSRDGGQVLRGGRVVSARVVDLEFFVVALDDFDLVRAPDGPGLLPWVRIQPAQSTEPAPTLLRSDFQPTRLAPRPEEGEIEQELRVGDILEHPTLGHCTVMSAKDGDRVVVQVEGGPQRELRVGFLKLTQRGVIGTRRHFTAEPRRRP